MSKFYHYVCVIYLRINIDNKTRITRSTYTTFIGCDMLHFCPSNKFTVYIAFVIADSIVVNE